MLNKTVGEVQIWKNPEERAYFVRTLIEKGFCENYETNFRCKDGKVLTGLLSAKIIMLKGLAHILSVTRDISDRKIIETALRESNDKYRELADLLPQIVFETDEKGQLTFVNKHAFKILRYPENFDIYGFNTLQLYIPEDQKRAVENIRSRFSGHPESNNEYTIVRYDSTRINVLVYSNPIFRNNKLAGLRGIIVDITRQKNAEEEIRRKNQELSKLNSLKDKLFSIISHDLRSPFTSILGFSELLQNNIHTYSPETVDKVAGYIKKSANNTFRLLDDLLNWTMTQTSQFIPDPVMLNIPEVIQEVINQSFPLTMEKNIRIFQETGRVSVVASDKNMLTIILRNLITNAIKFTNPNGTIKVSSAENGSFIEITVRDNGIGMLEEIRGKLLTEAINKSRTGTGGEKGNGLGLSISFELIQKLGGELSIESEAGKGSKFTFTIPVVATAG
jgi:PAS domain S-box-containing protein